MANLITTVFVRDVFGNNRSILLAPVPTQDEGMDHRLLLLTLFSTQAEMEYDERRVTVIAEERAVRTGTGLGDERLIVLKPQTHLKIRTSESVSSHHLHWDGYMLHTDRVPHSYVLSGV